MIRLPALLVVCLWALLLAGCKGPTDPNDSVTRIAFGSCNNPLFGQPIWDAVIDARPDVWVWVGDNIYADSADVSRHRRLYQMQKRHPDYIRLKTNTLVTGTWDDHDYGANNAGAEYPSKVASQQALLDFLDVPPGDPRRSREGVYSSRVFGPQGRRLRLVILDTRYHRESYGPGNDVLGDKQWAWLENEFGNQDSDLILLVSSIAVMPRGPKHAEGWVRFPESEKRLLKAISAAAAPVIILSGDRHIGEISRLEQADANWPLFEVMSSGMTHAANFARHRNPYRVGNTYTALNFGFLEIDWEAAEIRVRMSIRDAENGVRAQAEARFTRLQGAN